MIANNMPYVAMKGLASAMYYPDPSLRSMGDVDFLVTKENVSHAGKLLESVKLFDVYEGEQVGEGKKSVAFSLTFRDKTKTLEDKDVTTAVDKLLEELKSMGIEIRG